VPTQIGPVTLGVADVERSMGFYRDLLGLRELSSAGAVVTLGAGAEPVLHLVGETGAAPPPPRASGLYHTAFLFPDRAALARVVTHLAANEYEFTGASDHLVSEAFYLDDPDGLGVELYRDRPRAEWRWKDGRIEMASLPLDVQDVLSNADRGFDGAPEGTRVGHLHLKVSGISEAEEFYRGILGFDVMTRFGDSASFLSAGGYHHHLGANIWQSRGAPPAPDGFAGLRAFTIEANGAADMRAIEARAVAAGRPIALAENALMLTDPWRHRIHVRAAPETGQQGISSKEVRNP
jgi:catechol 2,3-dioxygenase